MPASTAVTPNLRVLDAPLTRTASRANGVKFFHEAPNGPLMTTDYLAYN